MRMEVDYVPATALPALLADACVLAVFGFAAGDRAPASADPRYLRVPLQPIGGPALLEVWRSAHPVKSGHSDGVTWSEDGALQFGVIEVDEAQAGGIEAATEQAYRRLTGHLQASGYLHALRIWNYLDAITLGEGDEERYRRFCVGRARGMGQVEAGSLPAATAIGRCDGVRRIQIYWLAGIHPGVPVENPRQVSAYRYPRQYGPQPPGFARAMLPPSGASLPLLLSGTASIVGHVSLHPESVEAQLDETFANFDNLIGAARQHRPSLPAAFGRRSRLKVYVRNAEDIPVVTRELRTRLDDVPHIVLHAAVCRHELRVEIDGVHA